MLEEQGTNPQEGHPNQPVGSETPVPGPFNNAPVKPPPFLPFNQFEFGGARDLPNATPVLVLGIISIFGCCCYGLPGVIFGIIALVLARKDKALYDANPGLYTISSQKNLNAGRICAIIGLSLAALVIVFYLCLFLIYGLVGVKDHNLFDKFI